MIPAAFCPAPDPRTPLVAGLSEAVDCGVRVFAQSGYEALTRPPSPLPVIVTALLTLYVALVGWGMLSGRGPRLSDTPQLAFRVGAVLALTASWPLFQTLVFRTAFDGAAELAAVIAGPGEGLWNGLQNAYDQIVAAATFLGAQAGGDPEPLRGGPAAAAEALWGASAVLIASTLGVTLAAKIVVGVLTAVGPVFVALFLLEVTRGAFLGWLRALVTAALMPLAAALGLALLLALLQPRLALLAAAQSQGTVNTSLAMGAAALIYVTAAAQACLVLAMAFAGLGLRLKAEPAPRSASETPSVSERPASASRATDLDRAASVAEAARRLDHRQYASGDVAGERRIEVRAVEGGRSHDGQEAPPRLGQLNRRIREPIARQGGQA